MNEEFINNPRNVKGDAKGRNKGEYWCPIHGFYWQLVYDHNKGHGCSKCAKIKRNKSYDYSKMNNLGRRLKRKDPPSYVLDSIVYDEEREKVKSKDFSSHEKFHFRCANGHVSYREISNVYKTSTWEPNEGCIYCSSFKTYRSKGEREVEDWCVSNGWRLGPRRGILSNGRELDIFLPDQGVAIEYDGEVFHREGDYDRDKYLELKRDKNKSNRDKIILPKWRGYHKEKDDECLNLGIILIHIGDLEWKNNKDECILRIYDAVKRSKNISRGYQSNLYVNCKIEPKCSIKDSKRYIREIPQWFREKYKYFDREVERNQKFDYYCSIHGKMEKAYRLIVDKNGNDIAECRYCKCTRTRNSKRIVPDVLRNYISDKDYEGLLNCTISSKDNINVKCPICGRIHNNKVVNMISLSTGDIKSLKCRSCSRKI